MAPEGDRPHIVDPAGILERNAQRFDVTVEQMLGRRRFKSVLQARIASQVDLRETAGWLSPEIGSLFGINKSTVRSNIRNAREARRSNTEGVFSNSDSTEEYMQHYLEENFPGVSLNDIREENLGDKSAQRIRVPLQVLARHLFYDRDIYFSEVVYQMRIYSTAVLHALHKPAELMQLELETWQKRERQRVETEKVQKAKKEEGDRIKQEKIDRERRDAIFADITLSVVAKHYLVDLKDMVSESRLKIFVQPRNTAQFIIFEGTDFSYRRIANLVGRTDHATATHSIDKVRKRMKFDPEFKERIETMTVAINKLVKEAIQTNETPEPVTQAFPSA